MSKTVSFSVSEETANRLTTLFPAGKNQQTLIDLLDAYEYTEEPPTSTDDLQRLSIENDELKTKNEALQIELQTAKQKENDQNNLIVELQNAPVPEPVEVELQPTQILVDMPEVMKTLLEKTAEKLSEKYQTEITPQDILIKMFLRYTVERYTQWFYPFVLSSSEIESITGKSIKELKLFINGHY